MSQPQQQWAPQQGQPQQYDPAAYQQQSPAGYGPPQGYAPGPQQGYAPQPPYQQGPPQQMPYQQPAYGPPGGGWAGPQQGGWGAPQQQAPVEVVAGSLSEFYEQPTTGWGPGLPWKDMPAGTSYTFQVARAVTDADTEAQTEYNDDSKIAKFRDGRVKRVLKVPGNIAADQTFPDGRCQWYVSGGDRDELARAMAEVGAPAGPPQAGAWITVTITHHRKNKYNTWSAIKHIQYTTPEGTTSSAAPLIQAQQGPPSGPPGYAPQQPQYAPPQQGYQQPQYQAPAQQQPAYQPPAAQQQQPPAAQQPQYQPPAQQQYQPQQAPAAFTPPPPPQGPPQQQAAPEQPQQQAPAQPGQVPPAPGASGEIDAARAAKIAQYAGQ